MANRKQPEIRFSEFTDDWEERKLNDIVKKQIKGKAQFEKLKPGNVEYLDTARLNGGQAFLTNGIIDVKRDDVLILWDGSKAGTVYSGFEGALGSTLKAYRTIADSKFVYQFLKRHQENIYKNYRTPNIPHVQKDFLDVFKISVPKIEEQVKIGSFFKQLDDTIALHQRKLELLKEQKKGFLQKMFPKAGANIPEVRFAGFTDDWEEHKLEKVTLKIGSGKTPKGGSSIYTDNGIPLLRSQNIHSNRVNLNDVVYITEKIDKEMSNSRVDKGDVLLNITGASIGRTAVYCLVNHANVNQHVCIIRPNKNVNSDFIQLNLAGPNGQKQIDLNQAGGGREGLNFQQIAKMSFYFPKYEEQQKIGQFFKQLDDTIAFHQRELELLKETKKGFSQKMFV